MKNREKYKNELMDVINIDGRICGFVTMHGVFQMFGTDKENFCGETSCVDFATALQLWLDEEYEESEVDWNRVPIDTLVRVRNSEDEGWILQYFKCVSDTIPTHKFETWGDGQTSRTTDGIISLWKYCELAEEV